MEDYKKLVDELDAQIEEGLVLFKKKWQTSMDDPKQWEEPPSIEINEFLGNKAEEPSPTALLGSTVKNWGTQISNFGASVLKGIQGQSPVPTRVIDTEEGQHRIEEAQKFAESREFEKYNARANTPLEYKKEGGKKCRTRRKRKGPTGNRTRIAGFKVLSAKPLHHKTIK